MKTFPSPHNNRLPGNFAWLRRFLAGTAFATLLLSLFSAAGLLQAEAGRHPAPAQSLGANVVISQFRTRGPANAYDEFVEIFNPTTASIDISGWKIRRSPATGGAPADQFSGFPSGTNIAPGQYILVAASSYSGSIMPDYAFTVSATTGIADDGGIALTRGDNSVVDQVGMSSVTVYGEGTRLSAITSNTDWAYLRNPDGTEGVCFDFNNNDYDFVFITPSQPRNSSSPFTPCPSPTPTPEWQRMILINEVAWGGTRADDILAQWIELHNPGSTDVDMAGWYLRIPGKGDILLNGTILAGGYYLIERNQSDTDVPADLVYAFPFLDTNGDRLFLYNDTHNLVDSANANGGPWPAGNRFGNYASMERRSNEPDTDAAWLTFNGTLFAFDRLGNSIYGSPKSKNIDGATSTPTLTPTATNTPTQTFTATQTRTPTQTLTPTQTFTSLPPRVVVINEIAWMGTNANANHEWIELHNPGATPINITGWTLSAVDSAFTITLNGIIPAGGYFLLERGTDNAVRNIPADQIYSGVLVDTGMRLELRSASGQVIDTANASGGAWHAGDRNSRCSMERLRANLPDSPSAWITNAGTQSNGLDANGNPICGTPRNVNWAYAYVTPTPSIVPTITPTPSITLTATLAPLRSVIINEIAWMGTEANVNHEWIELYNPGSTNINITGWRLISPATTFSVTLSGQIGPGEYFLLERSTDEVISDIDADQIYSGILVDTGMRLELRTSLDLGNQLIDTANSSGTIAWPAGDRDKRCSMERRAGLGYPDQPAYWITNSGRVSNGKDAADNDICGTPRNANWANIVTPTPTPLSTPTGTRAPTATRIPTRIPPSRISQVIINEFLPFPGSDWNNDGKVDFGDEFIELMNVGNVAVNLQGWRLDDQAGDSSPYTIGAISLAPGARVVFFASETGILLSNRSDSVRVFMPNGAISDAFTYTTVPKRDQSWCRLPDGSMDWTFGCEPTPGLLNKLAETIFRGERDLPAICQSPLLPAAIYQVECQASGQDVWSRRLWDGLLPVFQVFFERQAQEHWFE